MIEPLPVRTPQGGTTTWSVQVGFRESQWHVELSDGTSRAWTGTGDDAYDAYDAFRQARAEPEAEGVRFLVAGARLDTWPTPMSNGLKVATRYAPALMIVRNLVAIAFPDLPYRDVFSPAPARKVGTVAEQDAWREAWVARAVSDRGRFRGVPWGRG